jgi:methionyl-tRNA formyltransferase
MPSPCARATPFPSSELAARGRPVALSPTLNPALNSGARVAFAGTPAFAVPSLNALIESGVEVPVVLTQPDRPAGRGRQLTASPVKLAAQRHGLRVLQPETLRSAGFFDTLGTPPDLLIVIAYGLLLPREMLAWPRLGCVNLHASLLPRWRGAAPIQRAILERDATTGISVMRMEAGLDTGPVYLSSSTPIGARETAGELHDRLAALAASTLAAALPDLLAGSLVATPQQDSLATLAPKIAKADALLDWRRSAVELDAQIRAFEPWPVAETRLGDGRRLRVWRATVLQGAGDAQPGTIVAAGRDGIDVATADGVLRLLKVQPPSGRVMDASAYLAAHPLHASAFEV